MSTGIRCTGKFGGEKLKRTFIKRKEKEWSFRKNWCV